MDEQIVPVRRELANEFVRRYHRHHGRLPGDKFCIGLMNGDGVLRGVAIVGRPVSRHLDDGLTLEVTRTCTDGLKNANSKLYAAAWRATQALGYRRLITYTLPSESGASLRGAGWKLIGESKGGSWSRRLRPRIDKAPLGQKLLWEARLGPKSVHPKSDEQPPRQEARSPPSDEGGDEQT